MKRMPILLLTCAFLTGCSSQKSQSSAPEPTTEVSTTAEETTALETEPNTEAPTENADGESLGKLSYREVLESFYFDSELPGIGAVENMKLGDETNDLFAICDVDGDGSDELIIRNRDAGVADQIGAVYGHNDDGELVLELLAHESMEFYPGGCVKVFSAHNQGTSGRFLPYTFYRYSGGMFEWTAFVEAVDKEDVEMRNRDAEENGIEPHYFFPEKADTSGTGFVYYITTDSEYFKKSDYEKSEPMDVTEYEDWLNGYIGDSEPLKVEYFPLTEENLRKVEGDSAPFQPMLDIDLGEPDEIYFMNQSKAVFPAEDGGYYYYTYMGGSDSANYVLVYDGGDGNYTFLDENGSDDWFWAEYYRDGTFYGDLIMPALEVTLPDTYNHSYVLCAGMYRGGEMSAFLTEEGKPFHDMWFAQDYIYAAAQQGDRSILFYRFDYDGGSMERIAELEARVLYSFVVYDGRLICKVENSQFEREVGVIDLETGRYTALPDGGAVFFVCGGYIYYTDDFSICRMSLGDYSVEKIYEGGILAAVHDGYLIYRDAEKESVLYRLGKGENVQFFDPNELLGDDHNYYVEAVQSEGSHLYVKLSSGPFYSNIMEIDTDGNFIKQIYLHSGT